MPKIYYLEGVNIYEIPPVVKYDFSSTEIGEVALADTHGNVVKIWYCLMRHGLIKFKPETHQRLVELYLLPFNELTPTHIEEFEVLINQMIVRSRAKTTMFMLLGDLECDRTGLDWWTLLTLEAYQKKGGVFWINVSNHGSDFIRYYEKLFGGSIQSDLDALGATYHQRFLEKDYMMFNQYDNYYTRSLHHLDLLIQKGWITVDRFKGIILEVYAPALVLVGSTADMTMTRMHLYTHAPVGLNVYRDLGVLLNAPDYAITNQVDLQCLIFTINNLFQDKVKDFQSRIYQQFSSLDQSDNIPSAFYAYHRLIFDRGLPANSPDRPFTLPFSRIDDQLCETYYFFGHDEDSESSGHVCNLHSYCGRDTPSRVEGTPRADERFIDMATTNRPYFYVRFLLLAENLISAINTTTPEGCRVKDEVTAIFVALSPYAFSLLCRPTWIQQKKLHEQQKCFDYIQSIMFLLGNHRQVLEEEEMWEELDLDTEQDLIKAIFSALVLRLPFLKKFLIPDASPALADSRMQNATLGDSHAPISCAGAQTFFAPVSITHSSTSTPGSSSTVTTSPLREDDSFVGKYFASSISSL